MTAKKSTRKDRALILAVQLLREIDRKLESAGAEVGACTVRSACNELLDTYRDTFDK